MTRHDLVREAPPRPRTVKLSPGDGALLARILARLPFHPEPGPCCDWPGAMVRGRPVVRDGNRQRFVRRELYRLLMLDGRELGPHEEIKQDGFCQRQRCVNPWHAGINHKAPPWTVDTQLVQELVDILVDRKSRKLPFAREDFREFTDGQLRQAKRQAPILRRWMERTW